MPGALKGRAEIRDAFEAEASKARRDSLVAAGTVALFTLVALVGAGWIGTRMAREGAVAGVRGIVVGANALLGYVIVFTVLGNPNVRRQFGWVMAGALVLAGLVAFSLGTRLWWTHPAFFWVVFVAGALVALGLLGHAYEARDDYYLGWMDGRADNPFTYRDDIDRGHIAIGFLVALPKMVVGSFGELVGSAWLWGGLDVRQLDAGADALHALGSYDRARAEQRLRGLSRPSALLVMRWLGHLKLARRGRDGLELTDAGERFLGIGAWH